MRACISAREACCVQYTHCVLSPFRCLQTFTLNAISKFIQETTDQFWWAHLIIVSRCLVFNYGYLHLFVWVQWLFCICTPNWLQLIYISGGVIHGIFIQLLRVYEKQHQKKKLQREEKEQPRANAQHAAAHRLKSFKRKENIKRNCLI